MAYDAAIALALRLIKNKGGPCQLRHYPRDTTGVVADRLTGELSADGSAVYFVTGLIVPVPLAKRGASDADGLVTSHLDTVYVAGADCPVLPTKRDTLTFPNGEVWVVDSAVGLAPDGGAPILYTIRAGR